MNRTPVLLFCIGIAQTAPLFAARPAPADPAARTPAAIYQSAFEGYRGHRDEPIRDWRAVNDEVARVGGHIGIFRAGHGSHGSTQPAAPAQAEGQPPVRGAPQAPASAGHSH